MGRALSALVAAAIQRHDSNALTTTKTTMIWKTYTPLQLVLMMLLYVSQWKFRCPPLTYNRRRLSGATAFGGKWKSFHAATFVYQKPPACLQLHNSMSTFEVRVLISVHWEVLLQWKLHSCCACKQRKKKMNRLRDFPENYQSFNISCHLYCIL